MWSGRYNFVWSARDVWKWSWNLMGILPYSEIDKIKLLNYCFLIVWDLIVPCLWIVLPLLRALTLNMIYTTYYNLINIWSVMRCKLLLKEHWNNSCCTYSTSRQTILIISIWHVCTDYNHNYLAVRVQLSDLAIPIPIAAYAMKTKYASLNPHFKHKFKVLVQ